VVVVSGLSLPFFHGGNLALKSDPQQEGFKDFPSRFTNPIFFFLSGEVNPPPTFPRRKGPVSETNFGEFVFFFPSPEVRRPFAPQSLFCLMFVFGIDTKLTS